MVTDYHDLGWARFPAEPAVQDWVTHALPAAQASVRDPAFAPWMDCEGTWFIGVDALPNDAQGRVGQGPRLDGAAVAFLRDQMGDLPPLHPAQVSTIYPGYPRARRGESEAALRYRRNRDAAHVDGLKPQGPNRRRFADEFHAFILGLPLSPANEHAAPMVVWEGSHHIMRRAFKQAYAGHAPEAWPQIDLTDIYSAARRAAFETCPRRIIHAQPGEAYVLHRLALHGVAPWGPQAQAGPDGRMIAYFRPDMDPAGWLSLP